ncbi:hypothetical protein [Paenibacillus sp. FSL W7-1287]|uniref:hypothetical protein n=1 Tax=Paenibacillus sp. FSL W7-1287 TaxID=2954538 RepID=UPI0030FAAA05
MLKISFNPLIDFINALNITHNIYHLSEDALVSIQDADDFTHSCIEKALLDGMFDAVQHIKMGDIIEFLAGKITGTEFIDRSINKTSASFLVEQFMNERNRDAINQKYLSFKKELQEAKNIAETLHYNSGYEKSNLLNSIGLGLEYTIIPQLFMRRAPFGRYGYVIEQDCSTTVTIIFGTSREISLDNGSRFYEWYRYGIWHLIALHALKQKVAEIIPLEFPDFFRSIECFHPSNRIHQNLHAYTSSLFVNAVKLVSEQNVNPRNTISILMKEPYSKGLYHLEFFVSNLQRTSTLADIDIETILKKWLVHIKTDRSMPPFLGPLEACLYPHWNKGMVRAIFSPGISLNVRNTLLSIYKKVLKIEIPEHDISENIIQDLGHYNNLIFLTSVDTKWIQEAFSELKVFIDGPLTPDTSCQFAIRNPSNPVLFTKISISSVDEKLPMLSRMGKASDWIAIKDNHHYQGEISYRSGGAYFELP